MGLGSLLKKHSKDSSDSATPSLIDHSTPAQTSSVYSDAHSAAHSAAPPAKIILESESGEAHKAATIGSGTMDQQHPAPIRKQDGTTLTSIPASDGNHVTEIISSGAKVSGAKGYDVGATDKVVGESRGVNPELVVMTEPTSDTASTTSWLGKIGTVFAKDKSAEDEQAEGFGRVAALNAVAPPSATGADLSTIGLENEKDRNRVAGQHFVNSGAKDKVVPTSLVATSTLDAASTLGGASIAETITDEFDASPVTSNEKFHAMFPLIPAEETLIEDYRCALSREILIQGRLFVSESFLSFRANILGWQTLSTVAFSEIVSIEKQSTALVIPNAIHISTASSSHTFASLANRDDAYNLIAAVWKHNHPESRAVDGSGRLSFDSAGEERVKHDDENRSFVEYEDDHGRKKTFKFSKVIPNALKIKSLRSTNGDDGLTDSQIVKKDHIEAVEAEEEQGGGAGKHAATKYDGPEFENVVLDVALPTSPQKAFELLFKDESFIRAFWEGPQGLKEVDIGLWNSTPPTRELHYIRPLSGSIGPKQTLCNIVDLEEANDPEKFISILTETRTPDVPSGGNFYTKTRTVFTWSAGGGTKLRITSEVEWTKVNRMLRSIIESSCIAGQKTYHTDLETAVRAHIKAHPSELLLAGADTVEEVVPEPAPAKVEPAGNILDPLMDPLVLLSTLAFVLLLTNLYTFFFIRRAGRIGEPQEVAQAVERVLSQFSTAYSRPPAKDMDRELQSLLASIAALEKGLSGVKDRVVGLIAL